MGRNKRAKSTSPEPFLKLTKKEFDTKIKKYFKNQEQGKSRPRKRRCSPVNRAVLNRQSSMECNQLLVTPVQTTTSMVNDMSSAPEFSVETDTVTASVQDDQVDTISSNLLSMPSLDLFWQRFILRIFITIVWKWHENRNVVRAHSIRSSVLFFSDLFSQQKKNVKEIWNLSACVLIHQTKVSRRNQFRSYHVDSLTLCRVDSSQFDKTSYGVHYWVTIHTETRKAV